MMTVHEVQEFEAWVRAALVHFRVSPDMIDNLIKDDAYIQYMKEIAEPPKDKNKGK